MTMTAKGKRLEAAALRRYVSQLLKQADILEQEADEQDGVVLVEFSPGGNPYAYSLPEDEPRPEIGDEYITPVTYGGRGKQEVVTVVGYGRGGYTGPIKQLAGRVQRFAA